MSDNNRPSESGARSGPRIDGAPSREGSGVTVRLATEADLEIVAEMVQDFVVGHPAENHPRPLSRLKEAYFGRDPVARIVLAIRGDRIVGMAQWNRMYDMFWSMFGGSIEWLYVRPEHRGLGIPAALVAEICGQIRAAGGELAKGGANVDENAALYERVAMGWPARDVCVGGEAFQVLADLAGLPVREIVRRLPKGELNLMSARKR